MATRTLDRRPAAALGDPQQRIADLVTRKGVLLLRVARQWSLCADDAQDAYQRALEIYISRVDSLDPATETAWPKVVVIRTFVLPLPCGRMNAWAGGAMRPDRVAFGERWRAPFDVGAPPAP